MEKLSAIIPAKLIFNRSVIKVMTNKIMINAVKAINVAFAPDKYDVMSNIESKNNVSSNTPNVAAICNISLKS